MAPVLLDQRTPGHDGGMWSRIGGDQVALPYTRFSQCAGPADVAERPK